MTVLQNIKIKEMLGLSGVKLERDFSPEENQQQALLDVVFCLFVWGSSVVFMIYQDVLPSDTVDYFHLRCFNALTAETFGALIFALSDFGLNDVAMVLLNFRGESEPVSTQYRL